MKRSVYYTIYNKNTLIFLSDAEFVSRLDLSSLCLIHSPLHVFEREI